MVRDLKVTVRRGARRLVAVDGVSFELEAGGSLGVVGESGSGKSLTMRALMGLLPAAARVDAGTVHFGGEVLPFAGRKARASRKRRVAMVFQDPLSGLDPVKTVGAQVAEVPRRVLGASPSASRARALELLRLVGLPSPEHYAGAFPHQLSGGMRQRALIAIALASEPKVVLCDEPTTALDVTVQAQVLELLDGLRSRLGVALVLVSHDLAVVRQVCDQLAVMYAGRFVEMGAADQLLERPAHPYTLGLLDAAVDIDDTVRQPVAIPGNPPDPDHLPSGCPFWPRCRFATPDCRALATTLRPLEGWGQGRATACAYPERPLEGRGPGGRR